MSIFTRIKDAIFSRRPATQSNTPMPDVTTTATPKPGAPQPRPHTTPVGDPGKTNFPGIPASPADAKWDRPSEVDVEEVLRELAAKNPQQLNWKTSIVDLMKLLEIDSSLDNRRELASELGYTGDTNDSAAMNVWLHKRVMQELEKNGGKVPASFLA